MSTLARAQERMSIKDSISNRIKQRVRTKRGPLTPPFELAYRHIFVLPTKFGLGFGFMLLFMALGGLNFNNNMALILVFLLGTIAQMTYLSVTMVNASVLRSRRAFLNRRTAETSAFTAAKPCT